MSSRALALGVAIVVVVALALVGFVLLRDDDREGTASAELQLEDGLPLLPASPPEPSLGQKDGEPAQTEAVILPQAAPTPASTWDELIEKAEADGTVGVIVTLRTPVQPEGLLAPTARARQRSRVRSAGRSVTELVAGEGRNVVRFSSVPLLALDATPAALAELRDSPEVVAITEDVASPIPPWSPLDTGRAAEADTPADWWDLQQAGVWDAWNNGYDGRGQVVAIIDSGVQANNAWLDGKVLDEVGACFSRVLADCPNGTGEQKGAGAAGPCAHDVENCAHGTHVAHTAAGKYGVARAARIIPLQVFHRGNPADCQVHYTRDTCALSDTSDQLRALEYVYTLSDRNLLSTALTKYSIAAVNISIGGGRYTQHCDASSTDSRNFAMVANNLRSIGIATVVSSGNDGYSDSLRHPACMSTVVSVGATTMENGVDAVWADSNSAEMLNLLAPGVHICSAVTYATDSTDDYCWNGTSMAAPHVAGAFAVLRQLQPTVTVEAARAALSGSGTSVTDPRNMLSRTRIHVMNAVNALNNQ